jgi:hypothetical protein
MRLPVLFVVAAGLAACTALGPTSAPDWREKVSLAAPAADGSIELAATAEWFPDTQGFMDMRGAGALVPRINFRQGVFVLTPQSLLFMQWDSTQNRYAVLYRAAYADMGSAKVDAFGRNRRLVVFGKDYRAQSFGLSGPRGGMVDQAAVQKAFEIVSGRIPRP